MPDLKTHRPFGRTGLTVSRMGIASGYGVPAAAIEKAFHEYGVNYLWVSALLPRQMVPAIRNLAPKHRDEIRVVLAWPGFAGFYLQRAVEGLLRKLKVERADLVVIQSESKPPGPKFAQRVQQLKDSGKARFVGISGHNRQLLGRIAAGELAVPVDFLQVRYNAVHPGAEEDVFPRLPLENRHGIVTFTATCWGKLLKTKSLPDGERPLAPSDCYRFVLSHPDVDVCVTGPSTAAQLADNLKALDLGPLDDEEMVRVRRIGLHLHKK